MYDTSNIKEWREIARKEQLIPKGDWWIWLLLAGRGFGKTRTGAESVMELVNSGKYKRIAIIGKNIPEIRDIMVEGQSGLLSTTIAEKCFRASMLEAESSKATKRRRTKGSRSPPELPESELPEHSSTGLTQQETDCGLQLNPSESELLLGGAYTDVREHSSPGSTQQETDCGSQLKPPESELQQGGVYKRVHEHSSTGSTQQEADYGLQLKPPESGLLLGDTERRSGAYRDVREHSSPGSTQQETDCGGFLIPFKYYPSMNRIVWENGAVAYLIGADHYEKLRGYQFDLVWLDEFAKYKDPEALWQQIMFTLRLGDDPKCIITTTPKPLKILKTLSEEKWVYTTKGSTFANSNNLSPRFLDNMRNVYQNTRLGRQELEGEIIMEMDNAVWKKENIIYRDIPEDCLSTVVIGVDPAVTVGENSDETGIIVAGLGYDEKIYVLDDLSGKYKPPDWAKIVCRACHDYSAGRIVAETNNGGDLVREMLTTIYPNVPFKQTRAIRGKIARAEPISMLYEANRVFHTKEFPELEEQMCSLSYDDKTKNLSTSPDRVDALVWAVSDLKDRETCNISMIGP
ncbi:MAG: terminase family protein [Holosporales bacterium]|jgi:phage terminase large subunit-like protein|nr:terminase family protein [Holosporales bacterium]